jgi:hypothetical protein
LRRENRNSLIHRRTSIFPRWTSTWTPLDVKHVSYCNVKPLRRVRKNGKAWIPKHSITTICLPMSPAEHPTYIKEEKRNAPANSAGRQLDSSWTSEMSPAALPIAFHVRDLRFHTTDLSLNGLPILLLGMVGFAAGPV